MAFLVISRTRDKLSLLASIVPSPTQRRDYSIDNGQHVHNHEHRENCHIGYLSCANLWADNALCTSYTPHPCLFLLSELTNVHHQIIR